MSASEDEWATVKKLLALADENAGTSTNEARNAVTAAVTILRRIFQKSSGQVADLIAKADRAAYLRGYRDGRDSLAREFQAAMEKDTWSKWASGEGASPDVSGGGRTPGRDGTG